MGGRCRLLSNFMICHKCFRKTICLTKALFNFRTICCQSKKIEHEGIENARLKQGRKPSSLIQEPLSKRRQSTAIE